MTAPLIIGGVLGGANLLNSAIQGGKQNDLNQQALDLERARELDRQMLRDLFMQQILGGVNPQQAGERGAALAAGTYRPGGAPATQNPFERAPDLSALTSPTGSQMNPEDMQQWRYDAANKIMPGYGNTLASNDRTKLFQDAGLMGGVKSGAATPEDLQTAIDRFNASSPKKINVPLRPDVTTAATPPANAGSDPRATAQWLSEMFRKRIGG